MNDKITELDKEKQELIKQIEKEQVKNVKHIPIDNIYKKLNGWKELDLEEKKLICRFLIDRVFVFDGEIKIKWNLDDAEDVENEESWE